MSESSRFMERIDENEVFDEDSTTSSSSDGGMTSDYGENADITEQTNVVKSFLNSGHLALPLAKVSSALRNLQRRGEVHDDTYQQALCLLLKQYFIKKNFIGVMEELENVDIRKLHILIGFFLKKVADGQWRSQIVEAIAACLRQREVLVTDLFVSETCYLFVRLMEKWLSKERTHIKLNAAVSVVLVLYRTSEHDSHRLVVEDEEGHLEDTLNFVHKMFRGDEAALEEQQDVRTKLLFVHAVVLIHRTGSRNQRVWKGLKFVVEALSLTEDPALRQRLLELKRDGEDKWEVVRHLCGCSDDKYNVSKLRTKRRRADRPSSAGPPMSRAPLQVPAQPTAMVSDSGYTEKTSSDSSDAESAGAGSGALLGISTQNSDSTSEEILIRLDFIEKFRMKFCNRQPIAARIQERHLNVLNPTGTTIAAALWSVMQRENNRPDWRINNIFYEDFLLRLKRLVPEDSPAMVRDHRILPLVAEHFLVCVEVMSSVFPLVADVPVQPLQKKHRSTVYLLHVERCKYSGLVPAPRGNAEASTFDLVLPASAPPAPASQMSSNMASMLKNLAWLRNRQRPETFSADPVSGEKKKKAKMYESLTKEELEKLLKEPAKYRSCVLSLQGAHEGFAVPFLESAQRKKGNREEREKIPLRGRRNCGMAFDGDTVVVRVFTDAAGAVVGGRVVGVLRSDVCPVNRIFFCKVCSDQTTLMKPICATFPKIHVANEPGEAEYVQTELQAAVNIFDFSRQFGAHTQEQDERAKKKFAHKCLVTIYDVSAQGSQLKFKVKEVKRIQRLTCEKIFVVVYQKWSPYYLYPYGHVVGCIEPACGAEDELALMRLQCQLPHAYRKEDGRPGAKTADREKTAVEEARQIAKTVDGQAEFRARRDFRGVTTFTIDNADTEDMDDAISCEKFDEAWEVGVHITDVSHYLAKGPLDSAARERSLTLYGLPCETPPVHMLPRSLATDRLSLKPNVDRLCLSVLLRFSTTDARLLDEEEEVVVKSVVRSNYKLTKSEVAAALRRPDQSQLPGELQRCLTAVHEFAKKMRRARLKEGAFFHKSEALDLEEVGASLEADNLVEELMVEANLRVARFLARRFPKATLLRTNERPDEAEVEEWLRSHHSAVHHSGKLRRDLRKVGDFDGVTSERPLLLRSDVAARMKRALEENDVETPFRLLSAEMLHPPLQLALREWHALCKLARYQSSGDEDVVKFGDGKTHYGMDAEFYVQFTSPLRRYADILVHRFVHAALGPRAAPSQAEVAEVAETSNEMQRRYRQYERSLLLFKLYRRAQQTPLSLPCVISDVTSPRIVLDHCLIASLSLGGRSFTHAQLTLSENPVFHGRAQAPTGLTCTWRQRLFIVDEARRSQHANLREAVFTRRGRTDRFEVKAFESHFFLARGISPLSTSLHSMLGLPARELQSFLRRCRVEVANLQRERVDDVTSEVRAVDVAPTQHGKIVLNPAVTFSLDLAVRDPVRAQFMAPALRTARVRSPRLQYLQLCTSFGVCVEHRENAVACFGEAVGDLVAEEREFESVEQYQTTWLPILRMETITESMMDENSFHLAHVQLLWMCHERQLAGLLCLDDTFCRDPYRQIRFNGEGALSDCLAHDANFVDYLCIRVPVDGFVWIGHAGVKLVTTVTVPQPKNVLYFVVHQQSSPFPERIVTEGLSATVEVIVKTMPKRRQEKAVELLSHVPNTTAMKIALGQFEGDARDSEKDRFIVYTLHNHRFRNLHLNTASCNRFQRKAIENSFKWPISLIWGPPGTGKTITGVQITFWFTEFNKLKNPTERPEPEVASDSDEEPDAPRTNYPAIWQDFKTVQPRKRRTRNSSSTSTEDGPSSAGDGDDLLDWIGFPTVSDKCVGSVNDVRLENRRRQVLYCGPSNDCVNCVADHLRTKIDNGYVSLVRVFSEQVELKEFPVPGEDASFSRFNCQIEVPENLLEISLHRLIRLPGKPHAAKLGKFDEAFKKVFRYLDGQAPRFARPTPPHRILQRLREASSDYHKVLNLAKSEEVRLHDVVLCTSAVSASLLVQKHCRFCQVIIDEAGMCTEAETLVPLVPVDGPQSASAAIENVVLIGDHKQLRPILRNQVAAELGLQRSMLQRHWTAGRRKTSQSRAAHPEGRTPLQDNRTMLQMQYRMHPSICEFPSVNNYSGHLKTGVNYVWTGLGDEDIKYDRWYEWTGLNAHEVGRGFYKAALKNANAHILEDCWPGVRRERFKCMPDAAVPRWGEEERIVFLHTEGNEDSLTLSTEEGNENSKCNLAEVKEVRRIYMELRARFSQPRQALLSVAVLSQYLHQVNEIDRQLKDALREEDKKNRMTVMFRDRRSGTDKFWKEPSPIVSTVVRSQGSEYDYVILSTVRSLPAHDIEPNPTPGWEKKYLGFITDINQVNVALTRARKGLIIIGNGDLLYVHSFWKKLLDDLKSRGCYVRNSRNFPCHMRRR